MNNSDNNDGNTNYVAKKQPFTFASNVVVLKTADSGNDEKKLINWKFQDTGVSRKMLTTTKGKGPHFR